MVKKVYEVACMKNTTKDSRGSATPRLTFVAAPRVSEPLEVPPVLVTVMGREEVLQGIITNMYTAASTSTSAPFTTATMSTHSCWFRQGCCLYRTFACLKLVKHVAYV